MREILFRGKRRFGCKNWAYGKLGAYTSGQAVIIESGADYIVLPDTITQCTGLNDIKSTFIFEGDIVNAVEVVGDYVKSYTGVINYNIIMAAFVIRQLDDGSIHNLYSTRGSLTPQPLKRIEVIGNVFDNPELLNKEEQKND